MPITKADQNVFEPVLATGSTRPRNLEDRFADVVNVKDFGAVGDFNPSTQSGSDDTAAFNAAINFANLSPNGKVIYIPPGNYKITSDLTTITKTTSFVAESQESTNLFFKNCNGFTYNLSPYTFIKDKNSYIKNISFYTDANTKIAISYTNDKQPWGNPCMLHIENVAMQPEWFYSGTTRPPFPNNQYWLNGIYMKKAENVIISNYYYNGEFVGLGTTNGIGVVLDECLTIQIKNSAFLSCFKGITVTGQSEGIFIDTVALVQLNVGIEFYNLVGPANNHVITNSHCAFFDCAIDIGDVGSPASTGCSISNCFILQLEDSSIPSCTHIKYNCTNSSITNTTLQSNAGSTPSVIGIKLSNQTNVVSNVVFYNTTNVINLNATDPVYQSHLSNCLWVGRPTTILTGNITQCSISDSGSDGNHLRSYTGNFEIYDQSGNLKLSTSGNRILFGNNDVASRNIDIKSSVGTTSTYDSRIVSSGGSNSDGTADLIFQAGNHVFNNIVRPLDDNLYSLGTSSKRWSVVYAATGTINTSDEREKTFLSIENFEKSAALEIKQNLRKFKFNSSIEEKGENARIHFGASAQQVGDIMKSHGLDPNKYGFYCYDEWDEIQEIKNDDGDIIQKYLPAGNRYGLRYEELLAFIISAI
jgi:hypothetical protein